jgi:hypothetical protein
MYRSKRRTARWYVTIETPLARIIVRLSKPTRTTEIGTANPVVPEAKKAKR